MSASVLTLFTETTLDGFPLWVVLLIAAASFWPALWTPSPGAAALSPSPYT